MILKKSTLFFLLFLSNWSYSQIKLDAGLLAYYPFSGNANDVSGNGLNGTTYNAVKLATDRFGNANSAFYFDGIDDYIKVSDKGALSTPSFSLCYFFSTEITGYQNCIGKISYSTGNAATYNSGISQPGPRLYFATFADNRDCAIQVNGTLAYTMFSSTIKPNVWHCVVNTFSNGIQKMYIDGTLYETKTLPFVKARSCNNTDFLIGSWWANDPYRFKGKIDDVRFYNRAINEDEVTALCNLQNSMPFTIFFNVSVINDNAISLKWNTHTEENVDRYLVKRSLKKTVDFITIGDIKPNKKSTSNQYILIDSAIESNVLYYYKIEVNNINKKKNYTETKKARIIRKIIDKPDFYDINNRYQYEAGTINSKDTFQAAIYQADPGTITKEKKTDTLANIPFAAASVKKRKNDIQETIYFKSDSLEISLFDNGQIDGDTVSVLMNGNIIIAKQLLKATAFRKMIAMPAGTDSIQLVMYAENLGSIPPNTGLLVVKDGKDIHEIRFSGDMQKNATIILRKKKL